MVAGIGESTYYKRGGATESEFQLACIAIRNAVADDGLTMADVDGFTSYMAIAEMGFCAAEELDDFVANICIGMAVVATWEERTNADGDTVQLLQWRA